MAEGVRAGDPDALADVYRCLRGPMSAWLGSQVRDAYVVEDLLEETFLELVKSCRTIQANPWAIRGWLYTSARRNVIDLYRRRQRRPETLVRETPETVEEATPEGIAIEGDLAERMREALEQLSEDQRHVLTLKFLAGLSGPEIASVVGKREGAVRALQHRGVAALARIVETEQLDVEPTGRSGGAVA